MLHPAEEASADPVVTVGADLAGGAVQVEAASSVATSRSTGREAASLLLRELAA